MFQNKTAPVEYGGCWTFQGTFLKKMSPLRLFACVIVEIALDVDKGRALIAATRSQVTE